MHDKHLVINVGHNAYCVGICNKTLYFPSNWKSTDTVEEKEILNHHVERI